MKKLLSLALTSMLALPLAAFGQGALKIGTINMDRAFKEYSKTKEAEKKVNDAKDAAKKNSMIAPMPIKRPLKRSTISTSSWNLLP